MITANNRIASGKKGFTLIEILVVSVIMSLVFLAGWAIYILGMTWYHEVAPRIDAQRIARLAMARIVDGIPDQTTGFEVIGSTRYNKRNGIAETFYYAPSLPNTYVNPAGKTVSHEIDYGLFVDYGTYQPAAARNIRSFYLATDAASGLKAVYYKDSSGAAHMLRETLGIDNLEFSYYTDSAGQHTDVIEVAVMVDKDIFQIGQAPYHVKVDYGYDDANHIRCGDTVYLRNVQQ